MTIPDKIELANTPTPIQGIFFEGFEILIKRDDYTGTELTGNKIRKLEYLIYDALQENVDCLITCGGLQSNHCRATAVVAARFGLKCILYLRGKEQKNPDSNLALMQLFGAEIKYVTAEQYANLGPILLKEVDSLNKKEIKSYFVPEGGSSELGIWGYIDCAREIKKQLASVKNKPSHIVAAVGSGGTLAGLVLGKKLFNLKSKIIGVNVLKSANEFQSFIVELANSCSKKYNLNVKVTPDDFEILEGYSNEGYENITDEKLQLITSISLENGILFDPAYTGKAFYGMIDNFIFKANNFNKLLFLHTGGIFGVFAKTKQYLKNI